MAAFKITSKKPTQKSNSFANEDRDALPYWTSISQNLRVVAIPTVHVQPEDSFQEHSLVLSTTVILTETCLLVPFRIWIHFSFSVLVGIIIVQSASGDGVSYPNSRIIDPPTYGTATNSPCANFSFPVHQNASPADRGALRAQKDWQCLFGSLPLSFSGNMRSKHNLVSVCMADISSERLDIVAYFVEVALILDDVINTDGSLMAVGAPYLTEVLTACDVIERGGDMDHFTCSPTAKLMFDIGKSMIDIDSERAKDAFRWIERYSHTMLSHLSGNSPTRAFEEYLKYKRTNFASQYVPTLEISSHKPPTSLFVPVLEIT